MRRRRENIVCGSGHDPPGPGRDLTLELTTAPPGITSEDPQVDKTGTPKQSGLVVEVHADQTEGKIEDRIGGSIHTVTPERNDRVGLDRSPLEHLSGFGGKVDPIGKWIAHEQVRRTVQHDPDSTVAAMFEEERDRAIEVRIEHVGTGDQELTCVRAAHAPKPRQAPPTRRPAGWAGAPSAL